MNPMVEKLQHLGPEIALLAGACLCLFLGLARSYSLRRLSALIAAVALVAAAVLAWPKAETEGAAAVWATASYVKVWTCLIGLMLLMLAKDVPNRLRVNRQAEEGHGPFDPAKIIRGEFFAFFLLSLTGVMLTAGSEDLAWLFLALELTSLPTYVMVATSRDRLLAQESGVKYFFLGAMAAAVFLYGFTLIYGATGTTVLAEIRATAAADGLSPMLLLGLVLSVLGVAFKIAAVPMHYYAADVYQGASTPVTAFLAFVPKTAGFLALILLLGLVRQEDGKLPAQLAGLVWLMAALTMTVGNVLGLLQSNVKRLLAYSSVAHSGYMLVGLLGSRTPDSGQIGNGVGAVLFYLVAYGLGTIGAFAVLSMLERGGEEAETFDDLAGLARRRPVLAGVLLLSVLSLIGIPPMVGFMGKIYLFGAAITHDYKWIVVLAVINSAISGVYYLRMVAACFFEPQDTQTRSIDAPLRQYSAQLAAVAVLLLGLGASWLVASAGQAAQRQDEDEIEGPAAPVLRAADAGRRPRDEVTR